MNARTSKPEEKEEYEHALFAAEIGGAPEIDLHGMRVEEALGILESFLHAELMQGIQVIKIIHGRGSGVLREAIHVWLKGQKELVLYFREAEDQKAHGAVTYAVLESIQN
ncbi:hypothetical protein COX00_02850 [Candidatus Uhrbacteria bacterium CG22_combo_CG10-13_8_21_14_all_47_17]|uniref:Smr domain-containing protein n=1 Tax=Candidatus Uhrbacteria bacterium CG22_combo_CG10-13_8_21_14_all_47_17 TaxID=1975041 RepID=A0A2H0BS72_9BACT|nr:MAG: hypothetical protein COX00_02850 [Candidatus Uhrbacteria bacterium CG22_combo_CG10-13_8_21_14_all_47_17]